MLKFHCDNPTTLVGLWTSKIFRKYKPTKLVTNVQKNFRRHNPANVHDRGWLVGWQDGLAFGWTKVSTKDFLISTFQKTEYSDLMRVLISGRTLSGSSPLIMSNAFNRGGQLQHLLFNVTCQYGVHQFWQFWYCIGSSYILLCGDWLIFKVEWKLTVR